MKVALICKCQGLILRLLNLALVPIWVVVGNQYGFPSSAQNSGVTEYISKIKIVDNLPAGIKYLGVESAG
tara:strand:+ start:2530 stop:2739 length:210 start_codon:yes stop_codon:yes gene_type:complete